MCMTAFGSNCFQCFLRALPFLAVFTTVCKSDRSMCNLKRHLRMLPADSASSQSKATLDVYPDVPLVEDTISSDAHYAQTLVLDGVGVSPAVAASLSALHLPGVGNCTVALSVWVRRTIGGLLKPIAISNKLSLSDFSRHADLSNLRYRRQSSIRKGEKSMLAEIISDITQDSVLFGLTVFPNTGCELFSAGSDDVANAHHGFQYNHARPRSSSLRRVLHDLNILDGSKSTPLHLVPRLQLIFTVTSLQKHQASKPKVMCLTGALCCISDAHHMHCEDPSRRRQQKQKEERHSTPANDADGAESEEETSGTTPSSDKVSAQTEDGQEPADNTTHHSRNEGLEHTRKDGPTLDRIPPTPTLPDEEYPGSPDSGSTGVPVQVTTLDDGIAHTAQTEPKPLERTSSLEIRILTARQPEPGQDKSSSLTFILIAISLFLGIVLGICITLTILYRREIGKRQQETKKEEKHDQSEKREEGPQHIDMLKMLAGQSEFKMSPKVNYSAAALACADTPVHKSRPSTTTTCAAPSIRVSSILCADSEDSRGMPRQQSALSTLPPYRHASADEGDGTAACTVEPYMYDVPLDMLGMCGPNSLLDTYSTMATEREADGGDDDDDEQDLDDQVSGTDVISQIHVSGLYEQEAAYPLREEKQKSSVAACENSDVGSDIDEPVDSRASPYAVLPMQRQKVVNASSHASNSSSGNKLAVNVPVYARVDLSKKKNRSRTSEWL
ncbi:uncharacterized protein LOC135811568 isoform X2 [Sycon ciliatum]|uniref:uncharacterized protein LOC135811568 isoform X2 n=1 Tax=Sycon ciliatum TaxID=27933 RepID=UPI0031F6C0D7